MKKNLNTFEVLILVFGIAIIGSLLFTIISNHQQKSKLEVYNSENVIEELTTEEKTEPLETVIYKTEKYSMNIPSEWTKVNNNGNTEFIHAPSATSLIIHEAEYYPEVNTLDQTSISENLVSNGYTLVSCGFTSNSSYEIIYEAKDSIEYIEETFWTTDTVVTLTFIFQKTYYDKMLPYLNAIYTSFVWDENAVRRVPFNFYLTHIPFGNFEFLTPSDWIVAEQNNAIFCTNQDNTAQMTVTLKEYYDELSSLSAYDLSDYIYSGREKGFILSSSDSTINKAYVEAAYLNNNGYNMVNKTYLYANGTYLYTLQFDYLANSIDDELPTLCADYFRYFLSEAQ